MIEIIRGSAGLSIWIWRFLITKTSHTFAIGYYSDFENLSWQVEVCY